MIKINKLPEPSDSDKVRFWSKVNKTDNVNDCWLWTGWKKKKGYGGFFIGGMDIIATRASFLINKGNPGDMLVMHTCDNPQCVNPNHLFLGTPLDNMLDKIAKGRDRRLFGENAAKVKLTDNDVINIRSEYEKGVTVKELSIRYNMSFSGIRSVATGDLWKHIPIATKERPRQIKERLRQEKYKSESQVIKKPHKRDGTGHWAARIKESDVIEIRTSYSNGVSVKELAAKYGFSTSSMGNIINRRSWKHI